MKNKVAIQGILFDEKSSFLRGAAKAAPIIRKTFHSGASNYYSESGIKVWPIENLVDLGDFSIDNYLNIEKITSQHLQNHHRILSIGGDHSISFPLLKAINKIHPAIHILQFDAHSDLYNEFEGDPYSHACPFARIMENDLANRLTQIGIRTLTPQQREQSLRFNVEIIEAKNVAASPSLSFDYPVYISLDMDVFDPAFAPGVSHHEPGGLSSRDVIQLIQSIDQPIIGADIVEYNPDRDIHEMTAALCAKLMKEIIARMIQT